MKLVFIPWFIVTLGYFEHVYANDETQKEECLDMDKIKQRTEEVKTARNECRQLSGGDRKKHLQCMQSKYPKPPVHEFELNEYLERQLKFFKAKHTEVKEEAKKCWENRSAQLNDRAGQLQDDDEEQEDDKDSENKWFEGDDQAAFPIFNPRYNGSLRKVIKHNEESLLQPQFVGFSAWIKIMKPNYISCFLVFMVLHCVTCEEENQKLDCFDIEKIKQQTQAIVDEHKACWESSNRTAFDYILCIKAKFDRQESKFDFKEFLNRKLEVIKEANEKIRNAATDCWTNQQENEENASHIGSRIQQINKALKCFWKTIHQFCSIPNFGPGGVGGPPPPPPEDGKEWPDN